jgi:hypothetical protein
MLIARGLRPAFARKSGRTRKKWFRTEPVPRLGLAPCGTESRRGPHPFLKSRFAAASLVVEQVARRLAFPTQKNLAPESLKNGVKVGGRDKMPLLV